MERDDNLKGQGNSYATPFRMNDPRLAGRWWSTDPITKPWESPYAGYGNNPVSFTDPLGLTPGGAGGNTPALFEDQRYSEGGGGGGTSNQPAPKPAPSASEIKAKHPTHAAVSTNQHQVGGTEIVPETTANVEKADIHKLPFKLNSDNGLRQDKSTISSPSAEYYVREAAEDFVESDPLLGTVNDVYTFAGGQFSNSPTNIVGRPIAPEEVQQAGGRILLNMMTAGVATEVSTLRSAATTVDEVAEETARTLPTIEEQAAEISKQINKTTVSIKTPSKVMQYDLKGPSHRGVPTPHVQRRLPNVDKTGKIHWNKDNKWVEPMTQQDIRTVKKYLKKTKS